MAAAGSGLGIDPAGGAVHGLVLGHRDQLEPAQTQTRIECERGQARSIGSFSQLGAAITVPFLSNFDAAPHVLGSKPNPMPVTR
jgi:hypothetical protein